LASDSARDSGRNDVMTTATDTIFVVATTCDECGCPIDPAETIPALDGKGRRCADFDACDDRKEARTGFAER
jgi:hypothetical protein